MGMVLCSWRYQIKDHCTRMMCPPLKAPENARYIESAKVGRAKRKKAKEQARSGDPAMAITTRWGSQFKECPTDVEIPKSKVKCTIQCNPGHKLIAEKDGQLKMQKYDSNKASCDCITKKTKVGVDKKTNKGIFEHSYDCNWSHNTFKCGSPDDPKYRNIQKSKSKNGRTK